MTPLTSGAAAAEPRLRVQLLAATLARAILNTPHRMVYPFLPAFSRGLGVPLDTLSYMLSLRSALGMTSPLFAAIPDRFGRRLAMLLGIGLFSAGLGVVGLLPGPATFFVFLVALVSAKFIFDPALQAYLGDRTPYARRGLVIAFSELGWSGAALIGIPLVGYAIERAGWRAPFLPLSGLGLAVGAALWLIIPRDVPARPAPGAATAAAPGPGGWGLLFRSPIVLAALGLGLLTSAANEVLNVVYGEWMEQSFGLGIAELGLSTIAIGLAELAGEGLVMGLADRLGKRRAIALGLAASALAYLALPWVARSLPLALGGLFFVFIAFEFTLVASLPLMTELLPQARGRVMTTNVAAHAAGRMLGALLGRLVFRLGFGWTGALSMGLNLLALALLAIVRERR